MIDETRSHSYNQRLKSINLLFPFVAHQRD